MNVQSPFKMLKVKLLKHAKRHTSCWVCDRCRVPAQTQQLSALASLQSTLALAVTRGHLMDTVAVKHGKLKRGVGVVEKRAWVPKLDHKAEIPKGPPFPVLARPLLPRVH